ncbi:hemolysin family protein [Curvivirga aplysinae]|uniref:hemolysin family protein n=1 Tax=Curvivirga aplysinae TaxID=2529852 RepID=UPI0012BBD781|nr:hemolysin family protein [Curvivirga aplysinae]MTI08749.1 HlyC/CorC family transporter [Curvivirga aplysinae]
MTDKSASALDDEDASRYSSQPSQQPKKAGVKSVLKGLFSRNGDSHLRDTFEEILDEIDDQDMPGTSLGAGAKEILENIIKAGDATAEDVMVPRADIDSIEDNTPLLDVISMMVEMPHSRYPIYHDTPDHVIGMVHIKDVLRVLKERSETGKMDTDFSLSSIRREVMFVAPSIRVLDLLVEMRESRRHMALIVDEYGGVDGLITIEDLVEEIVGDIVDEHDEEDTSQLTLMPDGSYRVEARFEIEDFEEKIGKFLNDEERDEDIDTMGGFIFNLLGRVPTRGELVHHPESGLEFEITDADPRRIKRMRIRGTENLTK